MCIYWLYLLLTIYWLYLLQIRVQPTVNSSISPEHQLKPLEYEVESIVAQRSSATAKKPFKVHWKGYSDKHDTWEPRATVEDCEALEKWLNPSISAYEEQRAVRMEANKVRTCILA